MSRFRLRRWRSFGLLAPVVALVIGLACTSCTPPVNRVVGIHAIAPDGRSVAMGVSWQELRNGNQLVHVNVTSVSLSLDSPARNGDTVAFSIWKNGGCVWREWHNAIEFETGSGSVSIHLPPGGLGLNTSDAAAITADFIPADAAPAESQAKLLFLSGGAIASAWPNGYYRFG